MKNIILLILSFCSMPLCAQIQDVYLKTYEFIESMLVGERTLKFADAVFAVENAYYEDQLEFDELKQELTLMT